MATFTYEILTKEGKSKKGSIDADSYEQAKAMVAGEGMMLVSLQEASVLNKDINISFGGNKIKSRDLAVFCRQFTSILKAGVSVVTALDMLSKQTANKKLAQALVNTRASVEKGDTLSVAMRKEEGIFPDIMMNMIVAGEQSGALEVALDRMATHFEKDSKIKGMVKQAMTYPCVILCVMLAVFVVMVVYLIPNFMKMFADLDVEMPALTLAIMAISDFVTGNWLVVLLVVVAIVVVYRIFAASPEGKRAIARIMLKFPIFGELTTKTVCARFARTLSTLLAAGMPLVDAVKITGDALDNVIFNDAMNDAVEQVKRGQALSSPMRMSNLFPPMVVHMVGIGEETGNMEEMLENVANYYDEEVETTTKSLTSLMEPVIILAMGIMVCVMVLAIYSPMMQLYNSF